MATQNNALTSVIVNTPSNESLADEVKKLREQNWFLHQELCKTSEALSSIYEFDKRIGEMMVEGNEAGLNLSKLVHEDPSIDGLHFIRSMLYMATVSMVARGMSSREKVPFNTLYVMWSESMQAVKIGRTYHDDAHKRASALRTGCPDIEVVRTFPDLGKFEAHLHKKFREFCVGGEWFSVTPEIAIKSIEELTA